MNLVEALILESSNEDIVGLWELLWRLRSFEGYTEEEHIPVLASTLLSQLRQGTVELHESTQMLEPIRIVPEAEWEVVLESPDPWVPPEDRPWFVAVAAESGEALSSKLQP